MSEQTTQEVLNSALKDLQAWKAAALAAQAERDALVAQNEAFVKAIKAIENDCIECSYDEESGYFIGNDVISDACDLVNYTTPPQCLAEIKAQAGRAGYLAAVRDAHPYGYETAADEEVANEYAESIRKGVNNNG